MIVGNMYSLGKRNEEMVNYSYSDDEHEKSDICIKIQDTNAQSHYYVSARKLFKHFVVVNNID
jgi:hypothetical protein